MRRIALFSDVHGNLRALEAALAGIDASGMAEVYCLGDLVGYGAEPAEVVALIRSRGIPVVRGNYDDGVGKALGGCGCYYATDEARADGEASYAFTLAALGDADRAWLAGLPDELRLEADGARVLLAHGSPRRINEYLLPDRPDAQLARLAAGAGADVVAVGHVHVPYHRVVSGPGGEPVHYVSTGSVGKPKDGDPRACWVEVVLGAEREVRKDAPGDEAAGAAGDSGTWVAALAHRVPYDVEAAARAVIGAGLPPRLAEALRTA